MPRPFAALLTTTAALLCALVAPAHAAPPPATSLSDGWQFLPDPADQGLGAGLQQGGRGEGWRDVSVPHVFDPRPTEDAFGGTVAWYRLRFQAPDPVEGFAWALRFEQVRRVARVWLDGREIGAHRDPYTPFTLPVGALTPGEHVLVVRVDNRKGREPREGWWNWGGITKPVRLVAQGALIAEQPGLMPQRTCDARACRWHVLADAEVVNRSSRRVRPQVAVRLQAPGNGPVSSKTVTGRPLAPGEHARLRFEVPVHGAARIWSPDDPALYDGLLEIRADGRPVQVERRRIGLRTAEVRNGLLRLNGRPVELRGASIQEDAPGRGPLLSDADIEWIVRELKALGANVTRSHYLLDDRLLRRLDEEGILLWNQAPIYHRDRLLETRAQREEALATLRATVLGARSHPSVITHSVANELSVVPDDVPGTRAYLDASRALTRDLDPTIPVSVDLLSYPGYPRQRTYGKFQLLGINSYFGWYPGKKNHSTADVRDLGPFLRDQRRKYPNAALVVTEFGAESTMDGPPGLKETYAFQTEYVEEVLDVVERTPHIGGAIYWTLREFAVKPDWDGGAKRVDVARDGIHNKGLITYDGRRKPAWSVLRANAAQTPLWRGSTEIAAATGVRAPATDKGIGGAFLAAVVAFGFVLLLALDVWAFAGIRRATRGEAPERSGRELHREDVAVRHQVVPALEP